MKSISLLVVVGALAGCGDNIRPMFDYQDPPKGGLLRVVKSHTKPTAQTEVVLDLVVGDQPLTGYSVGLDLPLDRNLAQLGEFLPGTALDPGTSPPAAAASHPKGGPLANTVVLGLSHKATGEGAIATDTTLAAGAVLFTFRLEMAGGAPDGVVLDGTAADFHLPSGGMRDRAGTTVVEAKDVAIGKLDVQR